MVNVLNEGEVDNYVTAIATEYPGLGEHSVLWVAADGLKLHIQTQGNFLDKSKYYNGSTGDTWHVQDPGITKYICIFPPNLLTAHFSLWSRFKFLEYGMLIVCKNNGTKMSNVLRSMVFFWTSYKTPVKVFLNVNFLL